MKLKYKLNSKAEKDIFLYKHTSELYEELEDLGIIDRMKEVSHLGTIKVNKSKNKSRYDYVMTQLYLHRLIKENLNPELLYTYNNPISIDDKKITMGDFLQSLVIIYNIGHFYNTFTSSRAVIMAANKNKEFYDSIVHSFKDKKYQELAQSILNQKNYQRLHLLNSLLILEHCDQNKVSISLAMKILYFYLTQENLNENMEDEKIIERNEKIQYAFSIFKRVRSVSYIASDLPIASLPLYMDLADEKSTVVLLKELLSEYNNNQSSIDLIQSISKLLDDTVYNKTSNVICYYDISKCMVRDMMQENISHYNYYNDGVLDQQNTLNQVHSHKKEYDSSSLLKLTFTAEETDIFESLLDRLDRMHHVKVGYYNRYRGEKTMIISMKKSLDLVTKKEVAYRILLAVVQHLRKIPNLCSSDVRFLLVTKFYLYYLFNERNLLIDPTIHEQICVLCARGKKARVEEIAKLLDMSTEDENKKHEVEFLQSCLEKDTINDTAIMIPASIIVFKKESDIENSNSKTLREFDGLIIYPMRREIVFLEAKNKNRNSSLAKRDLEDKFNAIPIEYVKDEIKVVHRDAYYRYKI